MFIITKTEIDELMFDILSENGGEPMIFKTEIAALRYIESLCEDFDVPSEIYMINDGIEISRMH